MGATVYGVESRTHDIEEMPKAKYIEGVHVTVIVTVCGTSPRWKEN